MNLHDPADEPFLPTEDELYWVRTVILWGGDRKPTRPVVVIEEPSAATARITVVTRTSDTSRKGCFQSQLPADHLITVPDAIPAKRNAAVIVKSPRCWIPGMGKLAIGIDAHRPGKYAIWGGLADLRRYGGLPTDLHY